MCERFHKSENVLGVKTMTLDKNSLSDFKAFVAEYSESKNQQTALRQFWQRVVGQQDDVMIPYLLIDGSGRLAVKGDVEFWMGGQQVVCGDD